MSSTILGIAHFIFHDGKFEDFRRLSEQCRHIVETQDTGTLRYDIYVAEDQARAVVVEEYENEDALRAHGEHIGEDLSTAVLATADVHGQLLGNLSEGLRKSLIGGPVMHFEPLGPDR